jgi:four helix bundle protein
MGKYSSKNKSYPIAIVKIVQAIQIERSEYVFTKQIHRSGTAIGALIAEAGLGQSKADFIYKNS